MRFPTRFRFLSKQEHIIASEVFGKKVPSRRKIIITNGAGLGDRAFTIPFSLILVLFMTLAAIPMGFITTITVFITTVLSTSLNFGYFVNVGKAYSNLDSTNQAILIHEMVHVLQGEESFFSISYVVNSCFYQILQGRKAYCYVLGKKWKDYTAEQQAQIIEDWFRNGKMEDDVRRKYIDENLRKS
ncbi:MAG: hypothetical protein N2Z23_00785 [Pyrinomonadaceae bacterium]|nr:hypothetical protein [Pyrinomonadaceae bacterium]MCX7638969.1 hypothetical protein [Pyrinomonadaceae bacterium]MDW8303812.1 hypothetical protein [Acidobacteriota bacterium]